MLSYFTCYTNYFTVNNGGISKNVIFGKFNLKCFKNNFLKRALHFLVMDAKPFHQICELLFFC